jgi:hypothetical protein
MFVGNEVGAIGGALIGGPSTGSVLEDCLWGPSARWRCLFRGHWCHLEVTSPINPFRPQSGPVAFGVVCIYGVFVAARQLAETRVVTEPWWVGVILLAMVVCGFAFVEGLWLYAQREVTFTNESLMVRRWIAVVLDRPGRELALAELARSVVSIDGGRLRIERGGAGARSAAAVDPPPSPGVAFASRRRSEPADLGRVGWLSRSSWATR